MTHSDSPTAWDHVGHRIRSQVPDAARTIPGNAWCYDCHVPIEATWTFEDGLQSNYPASFGKARRKSTD